MAKLLEQLNMIRKCEREALIVIFRPQMSIPEKSNLLICVEVIQMFDTNSSIDHRMDNGELFVLGLYR